MDVSQKLNQTQLSRLFKCSQPTVSGLYEKGVISEDQTALQALHSYIERLREEAAGRAADNSQTLTEVRIEESKEKTLSMKQKRLTDARSLVFVEDISVVLTDFGSQIPQRLSEAIYKIVEEIQTRYEIEIDDDLIDKHRDSALSDIAASARESIERVYGSASEFGTS